MLHCDWNPVEGDGDAVAVVEHGNAPDTVSDRSCWVRQYLEWQEVDRVERSADGRHTRPVAQPVPAC